MTRRKSGEAEEKSVNRQPTAEAYARTLLVIYEGSSNHREWARREIERVFRIAATEGFRLQCETESKNFDPEPIPDLPA